MVHTTVVVCLMAAVLALSVSHVSGDLVAVNIHMKLDARGEATAIGYDEWCHQQFPSDGVFLATINQPHVTLYLTEFDDSVLNELENRLTSLNGALQQCYIPLNDTAASGAYGMWNVANNDCLQYSSDLIVNTTYNLCAPNQTIPAWVYKLPEPQRSEKIAMIEKYGSPNVFSQFQPHVTLAYDNVTSENFGPTFDAMKSEPLISTAYTLGMGKVGNYGTVLRGQDYADWPLAPMRRHRRHHKAI